MPGGMLGITNWSVQYFVSQQSCWSAVVFFIKCAQFSSSNSCVTKLKNFVQNNVANFTSLILSHIIDRLVTAFVFILLELMGLSWASVHWRSLTSPTLPWMSEVTEVFWEKSRETAISEAQSGEERENREDVRKPHLCLSLDILFSAKENLWDQGTPTWNSVSIIAVQPAQYMTVIMEPKTSEEKVLSRQVIAFVTEWLTRNGP